MSVINQMLKELEQRNENSPDDANIAQTYGNNKTSSTFKMIIIVLIIICLNVLGIYGWHLYSENEEFKRVANAEPQQPSVNISHKITKEYSAKEDIVKAKINEEARAEIVNTNKIIKPHPAERALKTEALNLQELSSQNNNSHNSTIEKVGNNNEKLLAKHNTQLSNTQDTLKESVTSTKNTLVTPLSHNVINVTATDNKQSSDIKVEEKKSSLSISRSNLSPERVVQNKLKKAEQAIIDNEIAKAEKLFEDILLIQPEHKGARKQLSALWYGRKLFRPALNLLSQGMDIYPNDIDFRLMQARILLSQNNNKAAFKVLNDFSTAQYVEYQVLLANTAQSLGYGNSVILAYQQLTHLEPHKGKWWMGLAVALDRDSQFEEAKTAYKIALSKGSLSNSSAQFIRQRMTELGE